jgi:hypothetical protein
MKTLKAICAATVLALSLSIPAFADPNPTDVHEPGRSCPSTGSITESGETESTDSATNVDSSGSFSAFADTLWALASFFQD